MYQGPFTIKSTHNNNKYRPRILHRHATAHGTAQYRSRHELSSRPLTLAGHYVHLREPLDTQMLFNLSISLSVTL